MKLTNKQKTDLKKQANFIVEFFNYNDIVSFADELYYRKPYPLYKSLSSYRYLKSSLNEVLDRFILQISEIDVISVKDSNGWHLSYQLEVDKIILFVEWKYEVASMYGYEVES